MRLSLLLFAGVIALARTVCAVDAPDLAPIKKWIAHQDEARTVQADFTQTRKFHSVRDPIASAGRIAYSASLGFRYELGDPPKMVVLRKADAYFVIQPAHKHAERMPLASANDPAGAKALPMMDFPLAKSFEDFNRKFEVLSVQIDGTHCHVEMLPRDPQARKFLEVVKLDFDTESGHLLAFEFVTRDGSSMRNEFSNVRVNQKIDPRTFDYDFTGYDVVDGKQ